MEKITGNEPINAIINPMSGNVERQGLTIRQHFAAMALQGILAYSHRFDISEEEYEVNCKKAVGYADALIESLNQK